MRQCKNSLCHQTTGKAGPAYCGWCQKQYRRYGNPNKVGKGYGGQLDEIWGMVESPPNECVEWERWKGREGYSQIMRGGLSYPVHRVALTLYEGLDETPAGMVCVHKNDTCAKTCINPLHLEWVEAPEKERDILAIRAEYAEGQMSQKDIAAKFGIPPSTLGGIVHRRTWTHI